MQLTKFSHSCVRLDDGDRSLVLDPGIFSEVDAALDGAQAVLITHEHADHLDADRVRAAAHRDPRLRIWAPQSVRGTLADLGEQVVAVAPGESFDAAGFGVQSFGGQHALIHPMIPMIANVAFLVDGVFHPGDSFTVPSVTVETLLLPTSAPWSKASEVIDYAIAVRARRTFQIHDAIVTPLWANIVEGHIARLAGPHGVQFEHLEPTATVTV